MSEASSFSESLASFDEISTPSSFAYSEDLSDSSFDPDDYNRAEPNEQVQGYTVFGKELPLKISEPGEQLEKFLALQKDPSLLFREITDPKTGKIKKLSDEEYTALNNLITKNQPLSNINVRDQPHLKNINETFPMAMKTDVVGSKGAFTKIHEYKRALVFRKLIQEGKLDPEDPNNYKLKQKQYQLKLNKINNVWEKEIQFTADQINYITPPKIAPPTTQESYNAPAEFSQRRSKSLRTLVPDTEKLWLDRFNRQLDLYLAPRQIKKQIESDQFFKLQNKIQQQNLRPFPVFTDMILRGNLGKVNSVDTSPNQKFLATGGKDGICRIYEIATGKLLKQIILIKYKKLAENLNKYYFHEINCVKFCPRTDVSIVACACANQIVFIDLGISFGENLTETKQRTRKFLNVNADAVKTAPGWAWECLQGTIVYKNGESVIAEKRENSDSEDQKFEEFKDKVKNNESKDSEKHRDALKQLDQRLVSIKYQNDKNNLPDRISLYSSLNDEIILRIHGPEIINQIDFNTNGNYLLSTSRISERASNVSVHKVSSGITQIPFSRANQVQNCVFSGKKLVVSEQKSAFGYDLKIQGKVQKFDCRSGQIQCSCASGGNVVFGHSNGGISFFGVGTDGFCENKNAFFRVPVNCININSSGLIAAGGADGTILILRMFDYKIASCCVLRGHGVKNQVGVTDLAWFGDNLVSCAGDGTVRIWR
ncbi:Ribosome biogenesis protein ERB1 [Spironucleus salmonicida]|uniref:Ribosome biogenesis protein ERB1 n=1 Tax=Spironucleus salmonicida TaxID=348837 RepID=V6LTL6_9EUKA|nr:Ribosome biogenesis protein ERB1 [Spironucleus salmonicida]|eukprot:EST47930.1 Ribosome biogenesis protein ERB1 [Spironucleus salmonicida]